MDMWTSSGHEKKRYVQHSSLDRAVDNSLLDLPGIISLDCMQRRFSATQDVDAPIQILSKSLVQHFVAANFGNSHAATRALPEYEQD